MWVKKDGFGLGGSERRTLGNNEEGGKGKLREQLSWKRDTKRRRKLKKKLGKRNKGGKESFKGARRKTISRDL